MRVGPTVAVVALAVVTTVGAVTFHTARGDDPAGYVRPVPPPPVGVFAAGGVPRTDPAIERVLAHDLPELIGMLWTGGREADRAARFAYLREHPALASRGPVLVRAWRAMIDELDRWWRAKPGTRAATAAQHALRARVDVVSDQLAALELGYALQARLEPELAGQRPGIFSYRIERVAFVRTNTERVRVLDARRLDPLDGGNTLLGMKSDEELDDPIVVLDAVEAKVEHQILPVLAGHRFPIASADGWRPAHRLGAVASAAIRRELLAALYQDAEDPARASARCAALIVASVRRHEAQHQLDQHHGLTHPARLSDQLGVARSAPLAVRARFELSAYLSQLAADVWTPQLTLWNLARHAFRRGTVHGAEAAVAVVAIEALAAKLHVPVRGSALRGGRIDRDRLAELMVALGGRTTVELRTAAAAAWRELYGAPLARIYD